MASGNMIVQKDTITHIFATQFAKEVEKLSDGKMKINVYPSEYIRW